MKKRFFLVAFLLALTFLASCSAALADDGIEVPPAELISDNPNFSIVDWHFNVMPLADKLELTRITGGISKVDSTHVYIKGVTQTNAVCWQIGGSMDIQQWKNNKWNSYKGVAFTDYDTNEATGTGTYLVASGYYYRLVVGHYAKNIKLGNVGATTTTASVLVN